MEEQDEEAALIQHPTFIQEILDDLVNAEKDILRLLRANSLANFGRTDGCPNHSDGRTFSALSKEERDQIFIFDSHTEASELFAKFCVREFTVENLDFIKRVEILKNTATAQDYKKFLKLFERTYKSHINLSGTAPVNLPAHLTRSLELKYEDYVNGWVRVEVEGGRPRRG